MTSTLTTNDGLTITARLITRMSGQFWEINVLKNGGRIDSVLKRMANFPTAERAAEWRKRSIES